MNLNNIFNYVSSKKNKITCLSYLYDLFEKGMYNIDFKTLIENGYIEYDHINIELYQIAEGKNNGMISYLTKDENLYTIAVRNTADPEKIIGCTLFYLAYIDLINFIENKESKKLTDYNYVLSTLAINNHFCDTDYNNFHIKDYKNIEGLINIRKELIRRNNMFVDKEFKTMHTLIHTFVNDIKYDYISAYNSKEKSRI